MVRFIIDIFTSQGEVDFTQIPPGLKTGQYVHISVHAVQVFSYLRVRIGLVYLKLSCLAFASVILLVLEH